MKDAKHVRQLKIIVCHVKMVKNFKTVNVLIVIQPFAQNSVLKVFILVQIQIRDVYIVQNNAYIAIHLNVSNVFQEVF